MTVDTKKYIEFVYGVTSPASTEIGQLLARLTELDVEHDADVPRLLTAALGLTAESGEFTEVVKKMGGFTYNVDSYKDTREVIISSVAERDNTTKLA